jgi:hypothetical protein
MEKMVMMERLVPPAQRDQTVLLDSLAILEKLVLKDTMENRVFVEKLDRTEPKVRLGQ